MTASPRKTTELSDPHGKKPAAPAPAPPTHWYEFDWLAPYQDLLWVIGGLLVIAGIALLNVPAACIAAGCGLMCLAWLMARAGSKES